LQRLGLQERITQVLQPPDFLPASTQGIIGLQCRQSDQLTRACIQPLADPATAVVAAAERTVARALGATCQVPLAVHAVLRGDVLSLEAALGSPDGRQTLRASDQASAADAVSLGENIAARLVSQGADAILSALQP